MKSIRFGIPFLLVFLFSINCQSKNGTILAESDSKKGIVRIYVFGELLGYEPQYSELLKQHGIELYHINQSEPDKLRIMAKYNEYMQEFIYGKFGVNFLDSLKSTICYPSISRMSISLYGLDTTSKDNIIGIAYSCEIKDPQLLEAFKNYNNWIESPNFRCIRNAHIELYLSNSKVDTMEAIISNKCNMVECRTGGKATYKFIPLDLVKILQNMFSTAQMKKDWKWLR